MHNKKIIVLANILNPINDTKCELIRNGAMVLSPIKRKGSTIYIVSDYGPENKILKKLDSGFQLIDYHEHIIMPAFFDMHFHWVQDDVRKMPKANLLDWLENYTFPAEKKFQNKKYSKQKANIFFERLVSTGTLGGACYSSIHAHALEDAFENVMGDFVIGNVLMTMNSPSYLAQTKSEALKLVAKMSAKYKSRYALTPRFAIATDPQTMLETGKLAKKNKSFIQTHLSETKNEIEYVLQMYQNIPGFEKVKSYTEIYKKAGLLGAKTIMGHGIYLNPDELALLAKTKTAIAHCPTSNAPIKEKGLGSGLFNFKKVEKHGIAWALGSDIGGGPILSMFDVMRSFVKQNSKAKIAGATYKKALYRATLAGAEILKLDKSCGNLVIGKEANFLVLPQIELTAADTVETLMEKLVKKGEKNRSLYDSLVKKVFYRGELVFSKN
jgi:guanine deaminase